MVDQLAGNHFMLSSMSRGLAASDWQPWRASALVSLSQGLAASLLATMACQRAGIPATGFGCQFTGSHGVPATGFGCQFTGNQGMPVRWHPSHRVWLPVYWQPRRASAPASLSMDLAASLLATKECQHVVVQFGLGYQSVNTLYYQTSLHRL